MNNLKVGYTENGTSYRYAEYTKEMMCDPDFVILMPNMSSPHADILAAIFKHKGHANKLLPMVDPGAIQYGLKYVHNDMCYPALLTIGQLLKAVVEAKENGSDLTKIALLTVQTGGICRATNYLPMIRKALDDMGLAFIPVIGLTISFGDSKAVFKLTPSLRLIVYGFILGDILMQGLNRTRPYETVAGSAQSLFDELTSEIVASIGKMRRKDFLAFSRKIIESFDHLSLRDGHPKIRVGVVGEYLLKYHSTANNEIVKQIEALGCEAVVSPIVDFFLYSISGKIHRHNKLGESILGAIAAKIGISYVEYMRNPIRVMMRESTRFRPPSTIYDLIELLEAENLIDLCNNAGEGWLLTAEMIELIHDGVEAIISVQPFGCMPNHIVAKGPIGTLQKRYPGTTMQAIDYDPNVEVTAQLNRIRLAIESALYKK